MLTYTQAIILGALQGFTELFPISSLGHSVLIPAVFHFGIDESAEYFVILLIATHLATALVLLGFFWRDWLNIALGFFRSVRKGKIPAGDTYARLAWVIVIATVPAGLLGLLFQSKVQALLASPIIVAVCLILNGALLYGTEILRKRRIHMSHGPVENDTKSDKTIGKLPFIRALGIGVMQSLALVPGFSRTGAALSGGLFAGLDHESAARMSFLLATPLILAASVLKLPQLLHGGYPVMEILVASIVSGVVAFFSIRFLLKYFETKTLTPFAVYCALAGIVSLVILWT